MAEQKAYEAVRFVWHVGEEGWYVLEVVGGQRHRTEEDAVAAAADALRSGPGAGVYLVIDGEQVRGGTVSLPVAPPPSATAT